MVRFQHVTEDGEALCIRVLPQMCVASDSLPFLPGLNALSFRI